MLLTLLSTGEINMNIRDKNGRTPLMYASRTSAVDNIRIIIDFGKDGLLEGVPNFKEYVNTKDVEGRTALDMVSLEGVFWEGWTLTIMRMLKAAGATDNIIPNENTGSLPVLQNENSPNNIPTNRITYDPIEENNMMVNFNNEYKYGRYYKKSSYNLLPEPKKNPFTGKKITKTRTYKAKLVKKGRKSIG